MALQRRARVLRLPTAGPHDTAALARALDAGLIGAAAVPAEELSAHS